MYAGSAVISPRGCTKPSVSKDPGPLEGIVEISVSLHPEIALFYIFSGWLSSLCGELPSPREGLSEPGHLGLFLKAQHYLRCP